MAPHIAAPYPSPGVPPKPPLKFYVIANGVAKEVENLPNDYIDVSVAAYATCFDGLLSKDKMTQDIYRKARCSPRDIYRL